MEKIKKDEQRVGEYFNQRTATKVAKRLQRETGMNHISIPTVTYRDLIPKRCWTISATF